MSARATPRGPGSTRATCGSALRASRTAALAAALVLSLARPAGADAPATNPEHDVLTALRIIQRAVELQNPGELEGRVRFPLRVSYPVYDMEVRWRSATLRTAEAFVRRYALVRIPPEFFEAARRGPALDGGALCDDGDEQALASPATALTRWQRGAPAVTFVNPGLVRVRFARERCDATQHYGVWTLQRNAQGNWQVTRVDAQPEG